MTVTFDHVDLFLWLDDAGDEGLMAYFDGEGWVPLIAADEARADQFEPIAQSLAISHGRTYARVRFTRAEVIDGFGSDGPDPDLITIDSTPRTTQP